MKKYRDITVSSGSGRQLSNALSGLGERKRRVIALIPTVDNQSTTDRANMLDHKVLAYKNQDQVCEFNYSSFCSGVTSTIDVLDVQRLIDLDLQLDVGDGFQVGFEKSTNEGGTITMVYEDL